MFVCAGERREQTEEERGERLTERNGEKEKEGRKKTRQIRAGGELKREKIKRKCSQAICLHTAKKVNLLETCADGGFRMAKVRERRMEINAAQSWQF